MRRRLAEGGVPQPQFAAVRALARGGAGRRDGRLPRGAEAGRLGRPARASSCCASFDDLDRHLHAALAESPTGEAILEEFTDGLELNGLVVARGGEPYPLLLSDRLRPARRRVRRRLDPLVSVEALRRRARGGASGSRCARCGRSGCATGSRSRS